MGRAKLFWNGQSQVVLLPEEDSWQTLFDSLNQFYADFMDKRQQPEVQQREDVLEAEGY